MILLKVFFRKFIYHEKATKFSEISIVDLSYVVTVKSTVEILQKGIPIRKEPDLVGWIPYQIWLFISNRDPLLWLSQNIAIDSKNGT